MTINTGISYKDAGVDIAAGQELIDKIKETSQSTYTANILSSLGGFFSLCKIPAGYKEPILVSTTDGVGTKACLAQQLNRNDTIGIDLVAMCVNDLIVGGAQPLFFLDYFATSKLDATKASNIIKGIAEGCKLSNCALTGGETAEMPGLYHNDDYDLAGFCVGIVEQDKIIDGSNIKADDQLIAIASSGAHSNGYSLIRKIIAVNGVDLNNQLGNKSLADHLLEPTHIYVNTILDLIKTVPVKAMAHITGGGITENLPRVLPDDLQPIIHCNSWEWPPLFKWLQDQGNVTTNNMYSTFNCGVGMILCVAKEDVKSTLNKLEEQQEIAWVIGEITSGKNEVVFQST